MRGNGMILSKPRLLRRAQLNGVSKGGEHPLWSRAGFKPRSRIKLIDYHQYMSRGDQWYGHCTLERSS